jgi:flagellar biosynthesis/type III secretory pathway protein FliH
MKQTVVEWLVDEMNSIKGSSTNMNGKIQFLEKELNKLYEQAKEMEKQRIKNEREEAYNNGYANGQMDAFTN